MGKSQADLLAENERLAAALAAAEKRAAASEAAFEKSQQRVKQLEAALHAAAADAHAAAAPSSLPAVGAMANVADATPKPLLLRKLRFDARRLSHDQIVAHLPKDATNLYIDSNTSATDATLAHIAKTCGESLQLLWCDAVPHISDVGLRAVVAAASGSLRKLSLFRTKVTDDGLAAVAACTQLSHLDVGETSASDRSLVPIVTSATALEWLNVQCCANVTDATLRALACYNNGNLAWLYCSRSGVTAHGVHVIRGVIESVKIDHF